MKHLQVTATIEAAAAPAFFTHLADGSAITETRLLEWSMVGEGPDTILFAIDGEAAPFVDAAPALAGIGSVEVADSDGRWTYALVTVETAATPVFDAIRAARRRPGFVVRKPIVYRDGAMEFHVVGDGAALQAAFEDAPVAVTVDIEEITSVAGGLQGPLASLPDRQRQALTTALALGYYEQPRRATQDDVATELGCAPQTASEHLQKAEATLVRAAVDEYRGEP
jgi:predicted DNA binding protein